MTFNPSSATRDLYRNPRTRHESPRYGSFHGIDRLGPLPDEDQAEYEQLKRIEEALLEAIRDARQCPLTNEEAVALVGLFGPDGCFGVAWTLLHLIESAPGWPIEACLQHTGNEWVVRLKRRIENARRLGLMP